MDENTLEFSIFCIENIADKLGVSGDKVYILITEKSNVLKDYIVPNYDALHTQDKEYIVNDIIEYMRERGVA